MKHIKSLNEYFNAPKALEDKEDEVTEKLKDSVGKGEDEIKMSDDDGYVTLTQKYDGFINRVIVGTESIPAVIKFLQKVK